MSKRLLGLLGALTSLAIPLQVGASGFTVGPVVQASGASSPFAACTVGSIGIDFQPGTNYVNAEVEPRVAINPTDPRNIVGVFQQDRWSNGGAHGLVAAVSHDGGTIWSRTWAPFSECSGGNGTNGGNYARASDPWVSFAPNGELYQISLSVTSFTNGTNTSAVLVSKSTNGGDTWSNPTTLISENSAFSFNDKESITADPTDPSGKLAYAVWDRSEFPSERANVNALHSFAFRGDVMFSRTTDGGVTWEAGRPALDFKANNFTIGNQIVVLPSGTLVDVFDLSEGSGRNASGVFQALIRSTDKGQTWSQDPTTIASEQSVAVIDPNTGQHVRTGAGLPDVAVDPKTGNLYVVWADGRFSNGAHDDIAFTMSKDGGSTWTTPIKVNQTPVNTAVNVSAFTPTVRVRSDGTVAVSYYDVRNLQPGNRSTLPTDYWMLDCNPVSGSCGTTSNWTEDHLAGPFDTMFAPKAFGSLFLGDYQGLGSADNTFAPFFVQANSDNSNRTDAFFTTAS